MTKKAKWILLLALALAIVGIVAAVSLKKTEIRRPETPSEETTPTPTEAPAPPQEETAGPAEPTAIPDAAPTPLPSYVPQNEEDVPELDVDDETVIELEEGQGVGEL